MDRSSRRPSSATVVLQIIGWIATVVLAVWDATRVSHGQQPLIASWPVALRTLVGYGATFCWIVVIALFVSWFFEENDTLAKRDAGRVRRALTIAADIAGGVWIAAGVIGVSTFFLAGPLTDKYPVPHEAIRQVVLLPAAIAGALLSPTLPSTWRRMRDSLRAHAPDRPKHGTVRPKH